MTILKRIWIGCSLLENNFDAALRGIEGTSVWWECDEV